jgi:hypothetical protein
MLRWVVAMTEIVLVRSVIQEIWKHTMLSGHVALQAKADAMQHAIAPFLLRSTCFVQDPPKDKASTEYIFNSVCPVGQNTCGSSPAAERAQEAQVGVPGIISDEYAAERAQEQQVEVPRIIQEDRAAGLTRAQFQSNRCTLAGDLTQLIFQAVKFFLAEDDVLPAAQAICQLMLERLPTETVLNALAARTPIMHHI